MTALDFAPPPDPAAPTGPDTCTCDKPDDRYLLTIDCGTAYLAHAACGKPPGGRLADDTDLLVMEQPIPVTLAVTPLCDGGPWHGLEPCDCGHTITLTPKPAQITGGAAR